jgi:hypothetical protein
VICFLGALRAAGTIFFDVSVGPAAWRRCWGVVLVLAGCGVVIGIQAVFVRQAQLSRHGSAAIKVAQTGVDIAQL